MICPKERKVHVSGQEIQLTYREFNLCQLFVSNPQRVFMRDELLEKVWGLSISEIREQLILWCRDFERSLGRAENILRQFMALAINWIVKW